MNKKRSKGVSQTPPTKPIITQTGAIPSGMALLLIYLLCITIACKQKNPTAPVQPGPSRQQSLVVVAIDHTRSIEGLTYLDTATAHDLYQTLALNGGGAIKIYGIYNNSARQNVLSISVPCIDTQQIDEEANIYQAGRKRNANKRMITDFEKRSQVDLARFDEKITEPCSSTHSDIAGLFPLIEQTLEQENFRGHRKYLLLCTDMIDDPVGHRSTLEPLHLTNTTVLIIRPALLVKKLKALFPDSPVYVFTDAHDIISFITNDKTN